MRAAAGSAKNKNMTSRVAADFLCTVWQRNGFASGQHGVWQEQCWQKNECKERQSDEGLV